MTGTTSRTKTKMKTGSKTNRPLSENPMNSALQRGGTAEISFGACWPVVYW